MRLTNRKKEILSYFKPNNRAWVTGEIDAPSFYESCVAWLIYGMESHNKRHCLESTRRPPEAMVRDGYWESPPSETCCHPDRKL